MAQLSFNDTQNNSSSGDGIGYFSLKAGQEALVRIMIDSMDDFDMRSVHRITVGNSTYPNREINCLREINDPEDRCPLCAAGIKLVKRIYIKMIQYDEQTGEPKLVVWDAPVNPIASDLKSYLNNYGPLSKILCKISRTGEKLDTKYSISPNLSPMMYPDTKYQPIADAFKDFSVLGRMVLDKTTDEIHEFMLTGNFPMPNSSNDAPSPAYSNARPTAPKPTPEPIPNAYAERQQQQWQANPDMSGQAVDAPSMDRPVRYY